MTTVSRTSQVTHSSVTGGGDWDHRLNRLLEDLQESVAPSESGPNSKSGGAEYREYRMTSSTKTDSAPPITTSEKWVEYGTLGNLAPHSPPNIPNFPTSITNYTSGGSVNEGKKLISSSSSSSSKYEKMEEKIGRGSEVAMPIGHTHSPQLQESSSFSHSATSPLLPTSSPQVERKEFYAKASYTTLIRGNGDPQSFPPENFTDTKKTLSSSNDRWMDDIIPLENKPHENKTSESRRELYSSETSTQKIGSGPMYTSTPVKNYSSNYSATNSSNTNFVCPAAKNNYRDERCVTPPPKASEGLKTPPLVRKILQQSSSSSSTVTKTQRPPTGPEKYIEEPPSGSATQYFTSTTTRNETREREMTPVKRFPSPIPPKDQFDGTPKRLDDLLATFGESYTETSKIGGDGGGPHKSHPYGPGTHRVRIDENNQSRSLIDSDSNLVQRKTAPIETKNVSGPPVFYPPGQMFSKSEENALLEAEGKGKAKMKMDRKYKAKEKMKQSHDERGGQGAVPVPVCLPVCCAAPCTIM